MVFTSLTFLGVFFPLVIITHTLLKNIEWKNTSLLLFSLLFYAWGEPRYILLLLFSVAFNYYCALYLEKLSAGTWKKIVFLIAVAVNVGLLGFYKYANFFLFNVNRFLGTSIALLDITLPIGISFYTFQILSYLIDAYLGKVKTQHQFTSLAMYVVLFPQLVAGPIVRYETVEEEVKSRFVTLQDFYEGSQIFIKGLGKKVLIANQMALVTDTILNAQSSTYTSIGVWTAVICYMFQIYYDFSGYSDMAIGIGRMLGFHFNQNFNFPYMATTVTDFWRRWHISLSSWFKDYVYIPLGGSRVSTPRWIFNLFVVWGLTGLWHGASWNFVLWGLYYAVILVTEKLLDRKFALKTGVFRRILTLFIVLIGWVLFRCESFSQIRLVLEKMFLYDGVGIREVMSMIPEVYFSVLFVVPAAWFSFDHSRIKLSDGIKDILLIVVFVLSVVALLSQSYNPFIYFRF